MSPASTSVDCLGVVVAALERQLFGHIAYRDLPAHASEDQQCRALWVSHFGFTRTPLSKTIPSALLCDRASHQEAVARIRFCIGESVVGVITGEVGVGKTVAVRAGTSQLDPTAHHIYVATPPSAHAGCTSPTHWAKRRAQGAVLLAQTQTLLATEEHERRRRVVFTSTLLSSCRPSNSRNYGYLPMRR